MSETQTIYYFYKGYSIGCTDKELSDKFAEAGNAWQGKKER